MTRGRDLRRFFTAPAGVRALIVRSVWHLATARALLTLRGAAVVRNSLTPSGRENPEVARAAEIARVLAGVARRLPFETSCLDRSLALHRMLRASGIEATLRIGVAKHEDRSLAAHAWVEHHGRLLLDDDVRGFHAFDPAPIAPDHAPGSERT